MSVAVPTDPAIRLRGLRRAEYERLVSLGEFEGEHIELLGGALIEVSPQGTRHTWVITRLGKLLTLALPHLDVLQEKPFALDDESEPEPDVAVVDPIAPDQRVARAHLLVEVAETSQVLDLGEKASRYAAAGVPIYWVFDLTARQVVVHTNPGSEGYQTVISHGPDEQIAVLGVAVELSSLLPE